MQKLHFSIVINATKEKVWNEMLGEDSYKKWTEPFAPGSHYVGDWNEGSKLLFLAPGENGNMGMVSRVKESRPYDFISIEHLGVVENGKEDIESDKVKEWAGALENYTFVDKNGSTEVLVDMDSEEKYIEMFNTMWPKALQKLKEIAE